MIANYNCKIIDSLFSNFNITNISFKEDAYLAIENMAKINLKSNKNQSHQIKRYRYLDDDWEPSQKN